MTVQDVIDRVNAVHPNPYDDSTLCTWLSECEGLVQTEVLLLAPAEWVSYGWPGDKDTELLVGPPHDKLYPAYVEAKIDLANGEYDKYQNSMAVADGYLTEFERWFANHYRPADRVREEYDKWQ